MGRNVTLDFSAGGGSDTEFLIGTITLEPTAVHEIGNRVVLPAPRATGINAGVGVLEDVAISPSGPEPAWAYRATVRDSISGKTQSWLVGVPTGTTAIPFKQLTKFTTTIPPQTTAGMMQNWADTTEANAGRSELAADRAEAPTDEMNKNLIESSASLTAGALSAAFDKVFTPQAYGVVDTTGTTDSYAAVQACINEAAAVGGTVKFPAGRIRVNGQITVPFTLDTTGAPTQASMVWEGQGAWSSGRGAGIPHQVNYGGTFLDMRYSGPGAKISTKAFGRLEIRNMTFADNGNSSNPYFFTSNTTVHIHDNAFLGNPTKQIFTCDQDAIVLGGTQAPSGSDFDVTDNGPFQGYGSIISSNFFNNIRRAVLGQVYVNSVVIRDNTGWQKCGSNLPGGAFIELNPGTYGSSCFGNLIIGNLCEVAGYVYGVKITRGQYNQIIGNSWWDAAGSTLATVRFDSVDAKYNFVQPGYNEASVAVTSEAVPGTNSNTGAYYTQASQHVSKSVWLRGLETKARHSTGLISTPEITLGNGSLAPSIYSGAGSPVDTLVAAKGSTYLRTNGDSGQAVYVKETGAGSASGWSAIGASAPVPINNREGGYALQPADRVNIATATSTITLPAATSNEGKIFTIKNVYVSACTVKSVSGTIDGATEDTLGQWEFSNYISDGTNWLKV